ncbi:hypothetical protein [Paenibacillus sp. FJAT-26967]|uniref:hypothetical protein n=1 Tax=Paenibacillus sp. FJAT-26967 TaxID=1729690 RepID=UPI0020A44B6D|nr:hypothetical protein [Paenibacillus sp. FJAT-26967]
MPMNVSLSKSSKQLPVSTPPLKGFLRWAYTLSITSSYSQTLPWYYSNFIQLSCTKRFLEDGIQCFVDFHRGQPNELNFNNPFLITCCVNYSILSNLSLDSLIEFFVHQIRNEYYCIVFLDESRLSVSASFEQEPFPHHLFLYGYDTDERVFHASMFDKTGVYRNLTITFDEFRNAIQSMRTLLENNETGDHHTYLYQFKDGIYKFDHTAVKDQLKDYLNSENHINRINFNGQNLVYGLEIYDYLKLYYEAVRDGNPSLVWQNDIRHLHVLWEHKMVMSERISYMIGNGIIGQDEILVDGYKKLTHQAMLLRDHYIRHSMRPDASIFDRVSGKLQEFKEQEAHYLEKLLRQLEK